MSKIKVWKKEPGKPPVHVWISPTLKNLQNTVDGYIEHYALSPTVGIICNEEGVFNHLKFNCRIEGQWFFGTIIFVGHKGEEFDSCPWEKEDIKRYYPQLFEEVK